MTPSDRDISELARKIRQRTNQAKIRLDEMNRLCQSYEEKLESLVTYSSEKGKTYYKIPNMPDPPEEISLLASEVLHHLRSALDNLIVGLAVRSINRDLTNAEEKPISFPVFGIKSDFDSFREKNLVQLNLEYIDLLSRLQPIDLENDSDEDYNKWVRTALKDLRLFLPRVDLVFSPVFLCCFAEVNFEGAVFFCSFFSGSGSIKSNAI